MRDRVEGLGDVEYGHHASGVRLHAGQGFRTGVPQDCKEELPRSPRTDEDCDRKFQGQLRDG